MKKLIDDPQNVPAEFLAGTAAGACGYSESLPRSGLRGSGGRAEDEFDSSSALRFRVRLPLYERQSIVSVPNG
jgi:hypothetical protein